jgi:hypothetical protein
MIEPRWGHRIVAHEGRLYVVGGRGESARVLIYTPGKDWTTGADLPRTRDHLSVVFCRWSNMGNRRQGPAEHCARRHLRSRRRPLATWTRPPIVTSGTAEAVVDDVIFIFGGEEPSFFDGGVNDQHWKFDTRTQAPRWEPAPPPPLAVHGSHHSRRATFSIVRRVCTAQATGLPQRV